jgi:exopolysaccharide production protein ExoQ
VMRSLIERCALQRPISPILVATSLAVTVAAAAIAVSLDVLPVMIVAELAVVAFAATIKRPILLFYAYCAAIPFNFALPPGPAGTVARIAGVMFFLGYLIRRPDSLRPGTVPLVGWLFVIWALASCLWAVDPGTAFATWLSLAQLFVITVLIASLVAANPAIVRPALWSYAISATITAAIAGISYQQHSTLYAMRAASFADQDPNLFASLVLPAAVFLMGEVQSSSSRLFVRVSSAAALLICVITLALSGTRSAWVGIIAAALVWLVVEHRPRQVLAIGVLACGVGVLIASMPGVGDFLIRRAALSLATGGSGRTDIWVVGLSLLASAPLLGFGFGNFALAFSPYAITQASGASNASGALSAGRAPHNVLLGTSVETGLAGGILLVALFASALRESTGYRENVIRVALISLYVQSMFLDILLQKQLWVFLAFAFGLAASQGVGRVHGPKQPTTLGHTEASPRRVT